MSPRSMTTTNPTIAFRNKDGRVKVDGRRQAARTAQRAQRMRQLVVHRAAPMRTHSRRRQARRAFAQRSTLPSNVRDATRVSIHARASDSLPAPQRQGRRTPSDPSHRPQSVGPRSRTRAQQSVRVTIGQPRLAPSLFFGCVRRQGVGKRRRFAPSSQRYLDTTSISKASAQHGSACSRAGLVCRRASLRERQRRRRSDKRKRIQSDRRAP